MALRLDWTELVFSSAGRLGRGVFLGATAALLCALALYDQLGWVARLTLGWIVHPVLFFIGACLVSKRFHDFGRSGWRAAPVLLAFCLAWPEPRGVIGLLAVLGLAWSAIELGVTAGDEGFNRFGARARLD